jgi:hypothetical protein
LGEYRPAQPSVNARVTLLDAGMTSHKYDGTVKNPHWLEQAQL